VSAFARLALGALLVGTSLVMAVLAPPEPPTCLRYVASAQDVDAHHHPACNREATP